MSYTDPSGGHASEGSSNNSAYQSAENWLKKKSLDMCQPGCFINKLASHIDKGIIMIRVLSAFVWSRDCQPVSPFQR